MKRLICDVVVIGGGPAGIAAAVSARKHGAQTVIVLERDQELGGILQQCIHNGFGLHRYDEELTGPGYAARAIRALDEAGGVDVQLDTMVVDMTPDRVVRTVSPKAGAQEIQAQSVVLAMGCRERTRGAIRIPGTRPAGIYTAGAAQRMVNIEGYLPGKNIVIVGSGDIGLIMARRMTLEGACVKAVLEIMPYSNGLTRNLVQCLEDFQIPLYLSHTISSIDGQERVSSVACVAVDEQRCPIPGTEKIFSCDCILLSVGLIPENELSEAAGIALADATGGPVVNQYRETSSPGFFAAGNVLQVHDLVDWVSAESDIAGKSAALFCRQQLPAAGRSIPLQAGAGVRGVVPQQLAVADDAADEAVRCFIRAAQPYRKVSLCFTCHGEKRYERKLPIVKPSEMIVVDLPAGVYAEADGPIVVTIEEAPVL